LRPNARYTRRPFYGTRRMVVYSRELRTYRQRQAGLAADAAVGAVRHGAGAGDQQAEPRAQVLPLTCCAAWPSRTDSMMSEEASQVTPSGSLAASRSTCSSSRARKSATGDASGACAINYARTAAGIVRESPWVFRTLCTVLATAIVCVHAGKCCRYANTQSKASRKRA
jgi:hypothetical protein